MTSKAKWAESRAVELRAQAYALRRTSSGGSYIRAARKGEAVRRLEAQARRLEGIAARGMVVEAFDLPF